MTALNYDCPAPAVVIIVIVGIVYYDGGLNLIALSQGSCVHSKQGDKVRVHLVV